ncbi:HAD-like protein [Hymenopellis radicata]|nr:HAD-like protein [Hymenopellis radicata]
MSDPKITDFKVLVFDVYGTLADWETGIFNAMKPLLSRYPANRWSRSEALTAFESVEKDIQAADPSLLYSDVLAKAHAALEARLNALYGKNADTTQSILYGPHNRIRQDWPIFADSSEALHDLSKHYKLVVLSNALASPLYSPSATQYWFPNQISGSNSPFSLILTAQDVHSYKPALPGFLTALEVIQKDLLDGADAKQNVLWVAQSLFHDIEPAHRLGLRRRGDGADAGNKKYTWTFNTLGEMAEAVAKCSEA